MRVFRPLVLFLLLIVGGGILSLSAQNRVISGKILDAEQQPIVGGIVQVEGTAIGAVASIDGDFKLEVPLGEVILDVSYLGYIPQKVTVPANKDDITVYMQEDIIQLDEAIVIGYGKQKRVNLTGAVSVVGDKELENRVSHSVTHMLQGSVAGLNVTTSSGKPGSSATINVRGFTSINGADPLVLIDGAVGDLDRINPNDVESISVIKDAAASAVYGARAAFGVILVTTKSGAAGDGKATVRYSGRFGWEEPTTSTDYENTGYWSVYTVNKFWEANSLGASQYIKYNDYDMQQLLARVNDREEHPDRPWVVEEARRDGKKGKQWVYYGNYDWWDMLYRSKRPTQQHNVSISGGVKDIKYLVSGAFDRQEGIQRQHPDVYQKFNLRSKIDFRINEWTTLSNNTSFFSSKYFSLGDGSIDNTLGYSGRHALANFPMKNPDDTWVYGTPYTSYKVANGRHIMLGEGSHRLTDRRSDFTNTTRLVVSPIKVLNITADFTYRLYQDRDESRSNPMYYREYPDEPIASYATGAGRNRFEEETKTRSYYSANLFANYDQMFNDVHHLSGVVGANYEKWKEKITSGWGEDLSSEDLDDFNLVGMDENGVTHQGVGGGQKDYVLMGYFGRINYDYKGRYLLEASGRYDGSSRFASGHRWGFFPSASVGWRISEESFFEPTRKYLDNLKFRASYGSLGNQNIKNDYYTFARMIQVKNFAGYTFGEGNTMGKYSTLDAPIASDRTWETSKQWNFGIDASLFSNRLNFTTDLYIRDTDNMLIDGVALPAVYGADSPKMNAADLRTKGYELSISWRDQFQLANKPFEYSFGFNISDYKTEITKYDNPDKSFAKDYYEGMRIGEIWGFVTDGLFQTTEEAKAYESEVDLNYLTGRNIGGWQAGDIKFLDLDGDGVVGIGQNTADNPGDRKILGNDRPSLSYGINASVRWNGFDASVFFQGVGNHYWYPSGHMMNFWGAYSYPYLSFLPRNFMNNVWAEDNRDAYFPRPMAYAATSGLMSQVNDRYLQNLRYLRFKNLTIGYTIPANITKKARIDRARVYFSGENLCYWSPIKNNSKYVDPEAAIKRSDVYQNAYYPWPKTFMFGIDITF